VVVAVAPVTPPAEPRAANQGPRLVVDGAWSIPPGLRVALPVRIEPEASAAEHYVLITGLEPDSFVSRAVEVIGGTWMIKGGDLQGAQLERAPDAKEKIEVDLQLRANSGEIVSRTPVTVTTLPAEGTKTR
jgi:hypothetical protein